MLEAKEECQKTWGSAYGKGKVPKAHAECQRPMQRVPEAQRESQRPMGIAGGQCEAPMARGEYQGPNMTANWEYFGPSSEAQGWDLGTKLELGNPSKSSGIGPQVQALGPKYKLWAPSTCTGHQAQAVGTKHKLLRISTSSKDQS